MSDPKEELDENSNQNFPEENSMNSNKTVLDDKKKQHYRERLGEFKNTLHMHQHRNNNFEEFFTTPKKVAINPSPNNQKLQSMFMQSNINSEMAKASSQYLLI